MSAVIMALFTVLTQIAPSLNTPAITTIVKALADLLPVIVKEIIQVAPMVKNIIAALRANPQAIQEQLDDLAKLDAQVDQAFEAAVTKAEAEDAAAEKSKSEGKTS